MNKKKTKFHFSALNDDDLTENILKSKCRDLELHFPA